MLAFESFLAVVRSGNSNDISGVAHWEVNRKEDPTPEEIALVEKSRQDYVEMLQRAGTTLARSTVPRRPRRRPHARVFPNGHRCRANGGIELRNGKHRRCLEAGPLDGLAEDRQFVSIRDESGVRAED